MMNWYKKAQEGPHTEQGIDRIDNPRAFEKALEYILNHVYGYAKNITGNVKDKSLEFRYEDAMGTAYIQTFYSEYGSNPDSVGVSKYFESEYVDQEYGETKYFKINVENPASTSDQINTQIKDWVGEMQLMKFTDDDQ